MTNSQQKILVSSCLFGMPVRYDGKSNQVHAEIWQKWKAQGMLLPFCPELLAGLPIPRSSAEIRGGTGFDVIKRAPNVKIISRSSSEEKDIEEKDVTEIFLLGAHRLLEIAKQHVVKIAILKERSPSCGSNKTYDGSFSRKLISGPGVAAALLMENGIKVFSEENLIAAEKYLSAL